LLEPSSVTRTSLEKRCRTYQDQLPGSVAEEYLAQDRQLTTQTLDSFRLGYVADPLPGDEWHRGKLAIPYLTNTGVVQMRFRKLDDSENKYMGDPGVLTRLFNTLAFNVTLPTIYITEGEIDTMTLHQCGLLSIGLPGAEAWSKTRDNGRLWGKVYARAFRYRKVVVVADGDVAGERFANSITRDIEGVSVVEMDDREDVNSYFCKHGKEELRRRVGASA
jgi:DNA primase